MRHYAHASSDSKVRANMPKLEGHATLCPCLERGHKVKTHATVRNVTGYNY